MRLVSEAGIDFGLVREALDVLLLTGDVGVEKALVSGDVCVVGLGMVVVFKLPITMLVDEG